MNAICLLTVFDIASVACSAPSSLSIECSIVCSCLWNTLPGVEKLPPEANKTSSKVVASWTKGSWAGRFNRGPAKMVGDVVGNRVDVSRITSGCKRSDHDAIAGLHARSDVGRHYTPSRPKLINQQA